MRTERLFPRASTPEQARAAREYHERRRRELEAHPAPRTLSAIARDIRSEWKRVNYGAAPYLRAMLELEGIGDMYGCDDARSVVRYFLANATSFRGDRARALKAELRALLGED